MEFIKYVINEKFNNKTVLEFLQFYKLAKAKIYFYQTNERIKINNIYAKLNSLLKTNDKLELLISEEIDFIPENKDIDIIYEDDYLLILNKPSGLMVHPDDKMKTGTLANYVAGYYKKNNINLTIKYLHRIDTDTTGLVMFAKDILTHSYFGYLLSEHKITRTYLAICCGNFKNSKGKINEPIGEDRHHNQRRRVSKTGQAAITNYELIKPLDRYYSLVKVILETGRTHQIRVHMKHIGNPLAGDILYDGSVKDMNRVALHSYSLDFLKPFNFELVHLECMIPDDMNKVIKKYS